jgi:hypothetical protein
MTAVFTDHAVANLQLMASTTAEKAELSDLMMRLRDLRGSDDIRAHGGRDLARVGDIQVYLFPSGPLQVVLTTSQRKPDTVVVTAVYRGADQPAANEVVPDAILSTMKETADP